MKVGHTSLFNYTERLGMLGTQCSKRTYAVFTIEQSFTSQTARCSQDTLCVYTSLSVLFQRVCSSPECPLCPIITIIIIMHPHDNGRRQKSVGRAFSQAKFDTSLLKVFPPPTHRPVKVCSLVAKSQPTYTISTFRCQSRQSSFKL